MSSFNHPHDSAPPTHLSQHWEKAPQRIAIRCGLRALTYGELLTQVERTAAQLIDVGIRPGDPVAIACPDAADLLIACCAGLRVGTAIVLVGSELSGPDLAELARSGLHFALRPSEEDEEGAPLRLTPLGHSQPRSEQPDPNLAVFTAGTPGATLTWAELAAQVAVRVDTARLGPDTTLVFAGSPQDVAALVAISLSVLSAGGTVHFSDTLAAPDILELVAAAHATDLAAEPALLVAVRRLIESELAASPIYLLAAFEALQQDETPSSEERRRLLKRHHARLGSRLATLHPCTTPLDKELTRFFTRIGIEVCEPASLQSPPEEPGGRSRG